MGSASSLVSLDTFLLQSSYVMISVTSEEAAAIQHACVGVSAAAV